MIYDDQVRLSAPRRKTHELRGSAGQSDDRRPRSPLGNPISVDRTKARKAIVRRFGRYEPTRADVRPSSAAIDSDRNRFPRGVADWFASRCKAEFSMGLHDPVASAVARARHFFVRQRGGLTS
jgi:hypothetical protein